MNNTNSDSKPAPRAEREVPIPVRFLQSGTIFRAFTWPERIKILCGYCLVVEQHLATQHNPGRTQPMTRLHITPETDGEVAMRKVMEKAKAAQAARGFNTEDASRG